MIPLYILLNKNKIYSKYIKEDYDIEIAFLEGPITRLFSIKNKEIKKIAWVHNDISHVFGNGIKANLKKKLDKKIYSKYDTIVFVSNDNMREFEKTYGNLNAKKEVIYNYIDKDIILQKAQENVDNVFDNDVINFVTVARFVPQKAIDRLIKVHAKLIKDNLSHKFYVIGDGPEREKLEKMIKENNVQNSFYLLGKKENPYPCIKQADYFCLLSYFEGYGMVLEEAKILGKNIIITDTAAREAVRGYEDSIILENNEQKIYEGLKKILQNTGKSVIKGNRKKAEYNNKNIIDKIELLFSGKQ